MTMATTWCWWTTGSKQAHRATQSLSSGYGGGLEASAYLLMVPKNCRSASINQSDQIRIFNMARMTGVTLQSPRKGSRYVDSYSKCLAMIGETSMSLVCGWNLSGRRMTEYQETSCCRGWMQHLHGNERRPTVARRFVGTCSRFDEDKRRRWRSGRSATRTSWSRYGGDGPFSARNASWFWGDVTWSKYSFDATMSTRELHLRCCS